MLEEYLKFDELFKAAFKVRIAVLFQNIYRSNNTGVYIDDNG